MSSEIIRETTLAFRRGGDLALAHAEEIFDAIITESDEHLLVDLLNAWNEKGIAEDEIFSLASMMRSRMRTISSRHQTFVDAVGTGGSTAKMFNVSTAAAFVIAGANVPVAKHGNRAASSKTGSADVLAELGVKVDVDPHLAESCINDLGICFMFAPKFHSLSPILAAARRRVGRPTIFNCLGPLCNPASAPHQLIGAWDRDISQRMANVLARLRTKKSWVVHGEDGLDEITITGKTYVYEICANGVKQFEIVAEDFGLNSADNYTIPKAVTSAESAALIRGILENNGPNDSSEQLVLINAAAALFLSGSTNTLEEAYLTVEEAIRNKRALDKLRSLAAATNQ
jgi:anthranilate phosphoribosyltransferase